MVALLMVLGVFAMIPATPAAAADRAFSSRFSTNDTGDIEIVGNTLMTCNTATPGCAGARTAPVSSTANSAVNNNAYAMQYVDVDSDSSTFNSSQSTLALPAGATVLFAGLYWGGEVTAGSGGSAAPTTSARNTVKLKAPGASSYTTITASVVDDGDIIYQGFADVTSRVAAAGNGTYTVANVQTGTGADRLGGWSLVIAYRDTSQPARNLSVFDGLKSINGSSSGSISVSGFKTPPAGQVNTTLGFVTYEGDLGLVGDGASLNGVALADAQHPSGNFFDSRSSRGGNLRTGNNPSYPNNMGFEQSMLTVGNSYISNGATTATIGLTTAGDVYAPGVVTFATDLYAPKMDQTKTVVDVNGGLVEQGDVLRYTIAGTNNGQDGATGFVLRDPIPADTTYRPGTLKLTQPTGVTSAATDAAGDDLGEYDAVDNRVVARLGTGATSTAGGTIAVGKSYAVTFDVVVNGPLSPVADGEQVRNTATASFASASLGTPLTAVSSVDVTVAAPDLAIEKSHTGALVRGATTTYHLDVSNVGSARTQGTVTVTDALPSGLTYVSATGSGWTCTQAAGVVSCTRSDTLAPGAAYPTIDLVATVTDDAAATVANTGVVGGGGDGVHDNDSHVDSAPTVAITDLEIAKSSDVATAPVGGTVTWTLRVTNHGPSRSTGSTVVDTLPTGLTFVSASTGCTSGPTASQVVCELGALANGASTSKQITTKVGLGTAGATLVNDAVVNAHENDPTGTNDHASASVEVKPVDLAITSRVQGDPSALAAGSTYTWLLDVANLGTSPAADSVVRFTVPAGVTIVTAGLDPRCQVTGQQLVCDLGTVGAGASVPQIAVRATLASGPAAPASVPTTATVSTSEPEAALGNNRALTDHAVASSVDLSVTLSPSLAGATGGETLTLTATVANAGPGTPVQPTVDIDVPGDATFVSADPGCSYAAATRVVTCTLSPADLAPGAHVSRSVNVTVADHPAGPLTATATARTTSTDVDLSNNTATATVPVVRGAGLSITKTVDKATAAPGDTVTYTLVAANAGPAAAQDVVVTDALPAGTTYASVSGATCSVAASTVTCPIGSIAAGTSTTITLKATVDPIAGSADPTQSHQLDVTKVETHLGLPAGTTQTATATCPSGFLATDGGVRLDAVDQGTGTFADAVVLASSATADGTGWTGTVRNDATGQVQAKVNVVCLSARTVSGESHQHDVVVSAPVTSAVELSSGTHTVELTCAPGQVAVAPGWTFTSGSGQLRTSQRRTADGGTGWTFEIDVPASATGTFAIRCLSSTLAVSAGHSHDLSLQQLSGTVTVPAGQTVEAQLTCADDAKGIVASWSMDAGLVSLGNDPQPKTRVFKFTNPTGSSLTARIGLLCLSVRTGGELGGTRDITNTAVVTTSSPDATTSDDASSATFRAARTGGSGSVTPAPSALVASAGRLVKLAVSSTDAGSVTVTLLSRKRVGALRAGSVLARGTAYVEEGSSTLRLAVRSAAAGALRSGRVRIATVVVSTADGARETSTIRLR
ncbi:unannotated protein [freshwater metagenome]|uniref:Unannotated protein n=1 Tax=freshwater metagenome TaxID=449393 RepID=A0A6J6PB61_9ZZZZ